MWEISYTKAVEDIPISYIHDYTQREGTFIPGYLNPRRTILAEVLDDFFFTQDYSELMGASREGVGQVVNLDVRKKIANLPLDGMPHLGSGITWEWKDPAAGPDAKPRTVMASTNLKAGEVTVIDMKTWEVVKRIPTRGPGFFLRSHGNSRYAFVDSMMSPEAKHILQVIDKHTLEVVQGDHRRARQDARPHRVHPRWPLRARQPVGGRGRGDRARRPDPGRGQAPADEKTGRQVQRLEQDHARGRHQPLIPPRA